MHSVFVKTTWNYHSIPGNHICLPQFPAMILQFIFGNLFAFFIFFIAAEFFIFWYQMIRVIFIIIDLCSFKTNFINPYFFGQFFYIFYLMFIWSYHQKLEKNKWLFALQFFFPFHNIPGTFN